MSLIKSTPWIAIGRSAFLAVIAWAFLSAVLWLGAQHIPPFGSVRDVLLQQPLNLLIYIVIGSAIGGLATFLLLKSERILKFSTLWLLVLAVTVGMLIYQYLPLFLPINLYRLQGVDFNQLIFVGLVIGVFFTGKRYWL